MIARLSEAKFCAGDGNPLPAFPGCGSAEQDFYDYHKAGGTETNIKVNYILRGLSEWWSIARNRRQAIARVAYIIRYSIAKVYAAKFKIGTMAKVFKIAGNSLSKPIGMRAKSVVGADEKDTPQGTKKVLTGILFDRYHKIPKPKGRGA